MAQLRSKRGKLFAQLSTISVKDARLKDTIKKPVSNVQTVIPGDIATSRVNGAKKRKNHRIQRLWGAVIPGDIAISRVNGVKKGKSHRRQRSRRRSC